MSARVRRRRAEVTVAVLRIMGRKIIRRADIQQAYLAEHPIERSLGYHRRTWHQHYDIDMVLADLVVAGRVTRVSRGRYRRRSIRPQPQPKE